MRSPLAQQPAGDSVQHALVAVAQGRVARPREAKQAKSHSASSVGAADQGIFLGLRPNTSHTCHAGSRKCSRLHLRVQEPGQLREIRQRDIPGDQLFYPECRGPRAKIRGSNSGMIYKQMLCPRPIPRILSRKLHFKHFYLPVGSLSKVASQFGLSPFESENCTPYHVFASQSHLQANFAPTQRQSRHRIQPMLDIHTSRHLKSNSNGWPVVWI